jgi:hypothetical protein
MDFVLNLNSVIAATVLTEAGEASRCRALPSDLFFKSSYFLTSHGPKAKIWGKADLLSPSLPLQSLFDAPIASIFPAFSVPTAR